MSGVNQNIKDNQEQTVESKERSNKLLFLIVIILIALLIIGESLWITLKNRGLRHFTTADGLAAERVSTIIKIPNGEILVGGPGGISRIAGENITSLTLADGMASKGSPRIAAAPNGDIWVAYYDQDYGFRGVYRFNGQEWHQYPEMFDIEGRVSLLGVAPDGEVWFSNSFGLMHYDSQEWQFSTLANGRVSRVSKILYSPTGGRWFSIWEPYGLAYFDDETWEIFYFDDMPFFIHSFDIALDGTLWGKGTAYEDGTNSDSVVHYDGQDWRTLITEDELPGNLINAVAAAPAGSVWVGTNKGISRYDGDKLQAIVPLSDGMDIKDLIIDDQNNLWFTSYNHSFIPFDETGIRVYDTNRMLVPMEAIRGWRIMRLVLIASTFTLLYFAGERKSLIPVIDRLRTALKLSLITSGILFLILIVVVIVLSSSCGGGGVILAIPGFALTIILSAAAGVLVGYLQPASLRLTQVATIAAAVISGGITIVLTAALYCVP